MRIFVSDEFITEVKSIQKSKSHSNCEKVLIISIFQSTIDDLKNLGTKRLGGDPTTSPFLRKKIETEGTGKSSGYRLYFWLMVKEENVYLLFIHPKTGRRSGSNITEAKQIELVKTFKELRSKNGFHEVVLNKDSSKIIYLKSKKDVL